MVKILFRKDTPCFAHHKHTHRKTFYVLQHKIHLPQQETRSIHRMLRVFSFQPQIVRLIGLEPTRIATPDPKSGASTNFATSAKAGAKLDIIF